MLLEFGAAPFGPPSLNQPEAAAAVDGWAEAVSWIPTATTAN